MLMNINELQNLLGTKDAERFLKLYEPGVTEEQRRELYRKILNNQLAKMRREIRRYFEAFNQVMHEKSSIRKCLEINPRQEALEKMYRLLDAQEHNYKEMFANYGRSLLMLLPFYESITTDHDFAQILNANMQEVERYREDYMERVTEGKRKPDDSFLTALIFVYKIEPEDDCPFMDAMWHFYLQSIEENNELKTQMWNKAEECFPELRGCMVTLSEDENGQLVGQKYYPPLKLVK